MLDEVAKYVLDGHVPCVAAPARGVGPQRAPGVRLFLGHQIRNLVLDACGGRVARGALNAAFRA